MSLDRSKDWRFGGWSSLPVLGRLLWTRFFCRYVKIRAKHPDGGELECEIPSELVGDDLPGTVKQITEAVMGPMATQHPQLRSSPPLLPTDEKEVHTPAAEQDENLSKPIED